MPVLKLITLQSSICMFIRVDMLGSQEFETFILGNLSITNGHPLDGIDIGIEMVVFRDGKIQKRPAAFHSYETFECTFRKVVLNLLCEIAISFL